MTALKSWKIFILMYSIETYFPHLYPMLLPNSAIGFEFIPLYEGTSYVGGRGSTHSPSRFLYFGSMWVRKYTTTWR